MLTKAPNLFSREGQGRNFMRNFLRVKPELTPSIDVAISRLGAVRSVFAVSRLYDGSNLIQIFVSPRVDSGHTVSLLARSSPTLP